MLLYTLLAGALLASAYLAFPELTGRPFALLEFACGFVGGVAVSFAMMWSRYKRLSGKVVKSDGPTMSEHHVNVAEDGIRSSSSHIDHVYRWSAFEGLTVRAGLSSCGPSLVPVRSCREAPSPTRLRKRRSSKPCAATLPLRRPALKSKVRRPISRRVGPAGPTHPNFRPS
jgi:hypothetical protein